MFFTESTTWGGKSIKKHLIQTKCIIINTQKKLHIVLFLDLYKSQIESFLTKKLSLFENIYSCRILSMNQIIMYV